MSKKMLSLALALVMCLSLTVPASAVGQAGDTTIADVKGNTYTLSKPILYTISAEELNCIQNDFYLLDLFKERVNTIYAISQNTSISFPSSIGREGLIWVEIAEENGSFRVVDETAGGPVETSFGIDDSWGMTFIMLPCYLLSGLKDDTSNGAGGASGSSVGMFEEGAFVDYLAFYVPADEKAGNPFGSAVTTAPTKPTTPSKPTFTDVAANAYYADAVAWAVEKNITMGTSTNTFSPDQTCTNAQILTFLWRAKGSPAPRKPIPTDQYYAQSGAWAVEQGIVDTFLTDIPCTRAMVVTYLWKLAGSPNSGTSNFSDVSTDADYAQAVAWAVGQGVTSGTSTTTFSPDATCTRGQIVTFLYRTYGK